MAVLYVLLPAFVLLLPLGKDFSNLESFGRPSICWKWGSHALTQVRQSPADDLVRSAFRQQIPAPGKCFLPENVLGLTFQVYILAQSG